MEWVLFVCGACAAVWLIVHYAAEATAEEIKRQQAERSAGVKDAQLIEASKPRLSAVDVARRMRKSEL